MWLTTHRLAKPATTRSPDMKQHKKTEATSSICEKLLGNSSIPQFDIPDSVVPILTSHCEINQFLPVEKIIPNLPLFARIHNIVETYKQQASNHAITLVAGRGTTATRTLAMWVRQKKLHGAIHFVLASCPNKGKVAKCMESKARSFVEHLMDTFKYTVFDNRNFTMEDYESLFLNQWVDTFEDILLQCGDCGPMVITDTPWVNLFGELYLASGPDTSTKVILTRRDPHSWAVSRQETHQKCLSASKQSGVLVMISSWILSPTPSAPLQKACRDESFMLTTMSRHV